MLASCSGDTRIPKLNCLPVVTNPCHGRHYTDAVGIDPNSPLIYVKRAAAYVALRKPQEAIKDLGKALAIDEKMTQVGGTARPSRKPRKTISANLGGKCARLAS